MVNGKARYTAALAFLAVTLLTATGSSISAQDVVPQILPLDEEDDDVLICDDLDDDGVLLHTPQQAPNDDDFLTAFLRPRERHHDDG